MLFGQKARVSTPLTNHERNEVHDLTSGSPASKAIVTFHTTCDAMAFEAHARETGFPGRLTTIPRRITAGCGYAWTITAESGELESIASSVASLLLEYEGIYLL